MPIYYMQAVFFLKHSTTFGHEKKGSSDILYYILTLHFGARSSSSYLLDFYNVFWFTMYIHRSLNLHPPVLLHVCMYVIFDIVNCFI